MTDSLRSDRRPPGEDVPERDRDARIEEFLLTGLDHYFAGQHDLAINVWTRVLFIDRGHARARAYIERARSAVAERQRMGDELLHTGSAAFDRGEAGAARALVQSAVEHGASADEALALLARIDRFESAAPRAGTTVRRTVSDPVPVAAAVPNSARLKWIGAGVVGGLLLGGAAFGLLTGRGPVVWPLLGRPDVAAVSTLKAPLQVPSLAEIAVSRAEALYARGRLQDALAALAVVPEADPLRVRADRLSAVIQRQLLAAARSAGRTHPGASPRQP